MSSPARPPSRFKHWRYLVRIGAVLIGIPVVFVCMFVLLMGYHRWGIDRDARRFHDLFQEKQQLQSLSTTIPYVVWASFGDAQQQAACGRFRLSGGPDGQLWAGPHERKPGEDFEAQGIGAWIGRHLDDFAACDHLHFSYPAWRKRKWEFTVQYRRDGEIVAVSPLEFNNQ